MRGLTGLSHFYTQIFSTSKREGYIRHLTKTAALVEELGKDDSMATQTAVLTAQIAATKAMPMAGTAKRRSINPATGRALEILGHAIDYLTDEFVHEGGSLTAGRGQIDAIQLLIKLNRQIYMECPEAPTFRQWLRSLLHGASAGSAPGGNWRQA